MNDRHKRFITEYIIDQNATQAAIRVGYSKKTAYSQGQRLLKNVEIKKIIKELQKEIREANIAEAKEVEEFLSLSMRGKVHEEVVVVESAGDFMSEARIINKQISARDRLKAAELLGKRYSLFTDNINLEGKVGVKIIDDISSDDDEGD